MNEQPQPIGVRAYRFALDPTPAQLELLRRHAGAARWAFNHALSAKIAAHTEWKQRVEQLTDSGVEPAAARAMVKVPTPRRPEIERAWYRFRGDSRTMTPGVSPWWHEVSSHALKSGFADAESAWQRWLDSLTGRLAGRRSIGYPRRKAKSGSRDSFRLYHDLKRPTIRLDGYRRILIPRHGSVRIHGSAKRLSRLIDKGEAEIRSLAIARVADRWYVSVLCTVSTPATRPTRTQAAAGDVGVDLGVSTLATLSTGERVENPRHLKLAATRLRKAAKAYARTSPGSRGRAKAQALLARRNHEVALRRTAATHALTKRLATQWANIALEDLDVAGMSRSARGSVDTPGINVRAKAGLNRGIRDSQFGTIRRQLEYKTRWYGSTLTIVDRWAPTSKTCSRCGWRNTSQSLREREFHCQSCHLVIDRDLNAAINIKAAATDPAAWPAAVASGSGETRNARGDRGNPSDRDGRRKRSVKREGTHVVSPRRSDPPALERRTA